VKRIHVVTHTHWDREWYLSFEVFRERLVRLIDNLLEIIQNDRDYHFTLDGQTIILEDYAEVGKNTDILLEFIRKGNIKVGPWYVLPDEFLISGESWIRNYIYSKQLSELYNVPLMKVAYLPDMFGHNAYTPTVIKGLGMNWAVLWRGVGQPDTPVFAWKSPHGEEINVYHLINGYGNAAHFGENDERFKEKIVSEAEKISKNSREKDILLMNGTDHEFPLPHLNKILDNVSNERYKFFQSDLESFVSKLNSGETIITGELRSPKSEPVLKDVTSSRISGKIAHFETELLYENYVEPLLALAKLKGFDFFSKELWYGWKLILQSQPHDSICGCGVDEVHEDVLNRLKRAKNHGKMLCSKAVIALTGLPHSLYGMIVFNPLEEEQKGIFETTLMLPEDEWEIEGSDFSYFVPIEDAGFTISDTLSAIFLTEASTNDTAYKDFKRYHCLFYAKIPPLGFRTLKIQRKKNPIYALPQIGKGTNCVINENGSINTHFSGNDYTNLCFLKDVEDAGDEYNYSPIVNERYDSLSLKARIENALSTSFIDRKEIAFNLFLPHSLSENFKGRSPKFTEMPVKIEYTCFKTEPRIDVKIEIDNTVKDHRLTIVFPLGKIEELYTDGYFGLVKHKVEEFQGNYDYWDEKPSNTFALHSLVTVPSKKFTLVTRGLHEALVTNDGLELTLIRSVGWLSRNNLNTRKSQAGPMILTPGAQELGIHRFRFSMLFHKEWNLKEVYRRSRAILVEPLVLQGEYEKPDVNLPFKIRRGFISAFKPAENNSGVVLRLYNPDGTSPEVSFSCNVEEINLAEEKCDSVSRTNGVRSWCLKI